MAYPDVVLADSPLAYYRHEAAAAVDGLADASGNGHAGTFDTYGTGPTFHAAGRVDYAVDYKGRDADGANGRLDTLGTLGTNLLTATVELWFKTVDSTSTIALFGTVDNGISSGQRGILAAYLNSDQNENPATGKICLHVRDAAQNTQEWAMTTADTGLLDGSWHHVVFVVTSSTTVAMYVDGVSKALTQRSGAAALSSFANFQNAMTLAARNVRGTLDRRANVALDEVVFYTARMSARRAAAHYQAGRSLYAAVVLTHASVRDYWRLDETGATATDLEGTNDGTYSGTITKGASGLLQGDSDTAADFGGGDVNAGTIDLTALSACSVECWIKPDTLAGGAPRNILGEETSGGVSLLQLRMSDAGLAGGQLQFNINTGGTLHDLTVPIGDALVAAKVYHVVGTYDGTTARLYINGVERASQAATGNVRASTTFMVGANPSFGSRTFDGTIDEPAVYTTALSPSEVVEHYNAGIAFLYPSGIASGAAFGTPTVGVGVQAVTGAGAIPSAAAFGTPSVLLARTLLPSGIASGEAFGTPQINPPQTVAGVGGIASSEVFGGSTVADGGPTEVSPASIASGEAFGALAVSLADAPGAPYVPPSPGSAGSPGSAPRSQLVNERTSESYDWPINHSSEDSRRMSFDAELGAPGPDVGLVRRHGAGDDPLLSLRGEILDPAQHAAFEAFFAECEDDQLVYRDALGGEVVVVIVGYNAQMQRTIRNPRHPELRHWWRYSIDMYVVEVRAGVL